MKSLIVEIITIGEVERPLLEDLACGLTKAYAPLVENCLIGASLQMPPAAYNARRNQYDADLILDRVLHRITGENRVLALLTTDLYTHSRNLNFIFGQAQCPGRAALVSLCRLDSTFYGTPPDRKLFLQRATKEVIHELGHTFGLGHCTNPSCVMSFSNSILDVDKKKPAFCKTCRRKLHRQTTLIIHVWR